MNFRAIRIGARTKTSTWPALWCWCWLDDGGWMIVVVLPCFYYTQPAALSRLTHPSVITYNHSVSLFGPVYSPVKYFKAFIFFPRSVLYPVHCENHPLCGAFIHRFLLFDVSFRYKSRLLLLLLSSVTCNMHTRRLPACWCIWWHTHASTQNIKRDKKTTHDVNELKIFIDKTK